jgi:4'-phosphopantetheinyl transferase
LPPELSAIEGVQIIQRAHFLVAHCDVRDVHFGDAHEKLPQFLQQKIDAHKLPAKRRSALTAYWILARILGERLEEFAHNPHGKPYLPNGPQFSISHSKNHIAVAISDAPIGVDVETGRKIEKLQLDGVLSPRELAVYCARTDNSLRLEFLKLWTRKEAFLKCLGTGINLRPNQICTLDDEIRGKNANYKLITDVFDNYVLSVCCIHNW